MRCGTAATGSLCRADMRRDSSEWCGCSVDTLRVGRLTDICYREVTPAIAFGAPVTLLAADVGRCIGMIGE